MIHQKMYRVVERRKRKSTEGEKRAKQKEEEDMAEYNLARLGYILEMKVGK